MILRVFIALIVSISGFPGMVQAQEVDTVEAFIPLPEEELAELDAALAEITEAFPKTYRTVGDTLGLEMIVIDDSAILRWRPREFDPGGPPPQMDVRAAIGAVPVLPISETAILEAEDPAAITILIDVGPTISGEEVGAFLHHTQALLIDLPTTVNVTVQPLTSPPEFLPFTQDISEMQEQMQALRKSELPSNIIENALVAGASTADFGAIRQAVYIMSDGANCADDGAWDPQELADLYAETGVIYNVVLFADSEPSTPCLQSMAALTETSGGTLYPINQQGGNPIEPASSIVGIVGGSEIFFDLSGYTRLPFEPEDALFRAGMQFNGRSAEFAIPWTLSSTGWGTAIQVLTIAFGPNISMVLLTLAVAIGAIAAAIGFRRQPVRSWISPLAGAGDPQPIARGGLVFLDPNGVKIRLAQKGRHSVRVWGGVISVNGADTKDITMRDGDVFELSGGERFRLHIPGGIAQ